MTSKRRCGEAVSTANRGKGRYVAPVCTAGPHGDNLGALRHAYRTRACGRRSDPHHPFRNPRGQTEKSDLGSTR